MAKQRRIKRTIDTENSRVVFESLSDGKTITVSADDLGAGASKAILGLPNGATIMRTLLHGINAKVGDAASDPDSDAFASMTGVFDNLKAGVWSDRGTGEGGARVTLLAEAIASVKGMDVEKVVDQLAEKTEDQKKQLAGLPAIKAAMEDIKAKRAAERAKKAKADAKSAGAEEGADLLGDFSA